MKCYNYSCNYFYSNENSDVEYLNVLSMIIIVGLYNLMISIIFFNS